MAVRHAREQGSRVLAICNTNGSTIPRESDAVLYTHAGPEIAVASTKAFLAQITACYLLGLYLGAAARRLLRRRGRARSSTSCERGPAAIQQVLDEATGASSAGARARRQPGDPVPRPARRLPGGARGRAQAQGARVHPRRGLRRRRAQARADRADRGRRCRCSSSSRRRTAGTRSTPSWSPTSRRSAARGARTVVIAEDGDTAVEPYADVLVPVPATARRCSRRCVTTVPLQVFACHLAMAEGPRRRPAPQPGQVRHGRVTTAAAVEQPFGCRCCDSPATRSQVGVTPGPSASYGAGISDQTCDEGHQP